MDGQSEELRHLLSQEICQDTSTRDWNAGKNSLKGSFSNGPVEGHINRLKTLKREMYGRAGFELLRARLLPFAIL
jgi:transposase